MVRPIVVGVDGSRGSLEAAGWAGDEAQLRGAPVRIVHAEPRWAHFVPLVPQPDAWISAEIETVQEMLQEAANRTRAGHPDVQVSTEVVEEGPQEALVAAAEGAQLVVVGSRGHGGFAELLLGSVSRYVTSRAPCPAVVVRDPRAHLAGRIVVGVTGRPDQEHVLDFAFREADLRGAELCVLHAWTRPTSTGPDEALLPFDIEAVGREEEVLLAESVAGWPDEFPDVRLIREVVYGHPAKALIDASADHDLTIVGAHRGGRALLGLGSVAHAVVHHARGPVAVVRR
ncbi:universal stress protein [Microtetraspora niveoalba]|uniref:universal stress protein n=1 Tax=Microtetraspora niveoalba TaxID=46175 RepID=UPI0008377EE5|nr:universal stress protein [Microtetraspora niveoalba]